MIVRFRWEIYDVISFSQGEAENCDVSETT